ncbi:MFS transporter [Herbidospora sp. NEAU-GS84]|uniref:MFS transporter n=1 Tax=Herbidospora solisilvae TaxID=2696284 RepID=A0A7C9JQU6_9ACTN|nr:MFS transporter [Herbidospora solisilvae]NAS20859.1 MFS transporter [Herbidospora solisilvae]
MCFRLPIVRTAAKESFLNSPASGPPTTKRQRAKLRKRTIRLRRQRSHFLRAVASIATSSIGSRTLGIIYPLLAVAMGASPMEVGLVTFALTVPGLLFYMPAGVLADRLNPRSIMLFTEITRGVAVLSVLVPACVYKVTIYHLVLVAFLEGALGVVYSLADTALLSKLIPDENMTKRLAASETGVHFAVLAGRPLGGLLFQLGAPVALFANAMLFLCSGLFLSAIADLRKRRRRADSARHRQREDVRWSVRRFLAETRIGVTELKRHQFMRNAVFATTTTNFAINTVIVIFLAGSADVPPYLVGIVLAGGGIGGAIGSNLARFKVVQKYTRPGTTALLVQMWIWVFALCITTLTEPMYYGLATLVTGCAGSLMNVSIRTYELRNVERDKLARVVSVHRLASHAAVCLAAPLGGWLATIGSGRNATGFIFAFAVVMAIGASVMMPRWRGVPEVLSSPR